MPSGSGTAWWFAREAPPPANRPGAFSALPALAPRVRGVVLLDSGHLDFLGPDQLPAIREENARYIESQTYASWEAYLDAQRAEVRHFDEVAVRAGMQEVDGKVVPAVSLEASVAGMGIFANYWIADLPRLETPALLVLATQPAEMQPQRAEGVARLREKLPHLTVQALAETGHDLFADNPEQTLAAIWAFLDGCKG